MNDLKKDEDWVSRPVYSLPVRTGLWSYELAAVEDAAAQTAYKREHCQLMIQRTKKMLSNLLKPTTLDVQAANVMYDTNYLISACDISGKINRGTSETYYLSGVINDKDIDYMQHLCHGSSMTVTPHTTTPCARNTFCLTGCDPNTTNSDQNVCYGDDVYIRIADSGGSPLYLHFENISIANIGDEVRVDLSAIPSIYCKFKIYHWNPQFRLETMGNGFQPGQKVIIQHTATGQNLAAEYTNWIPTFFGHECAVTCHNHRDSHKMDTAENFWSFVATEKTNLNLYVRAAKGEDIPMELLKLIK